MTLLTTDIGVWVERRNEGDGPFIVADTKRENGETFCLLVFQPKRNTHSLRADVFWERETNLQVMY